MSQNNTVSCRRSASFLLEGEGFGVAVIAPEFVGLLTAWEVAWEDAWGNAWEKLAFEAEAGLFDDGFGEDAKRVAHWPQYSKSKGLSKPQLGQVMFSGEAHCPQNRMPTGFSNPHFVQFIAESSLGLLMRKKEF